MTRLHFTPGIEWGYTLTLLGILALLVLVAGVWIGRATKRRPRPAPPPHPVPPPPPVPSSPPAGLGPVRHDPSLLETVAEQRAALISGCVRARGLLDDQLLTDLLDDTLRHGGVQIVDPTGCRANSAEHRTAGTDPAPAPAQDGIISRTLRPAFRDAGRVVRPADVVVYKWGN
jgi:hypothetical protein